MFMPLKKNAPQNMPSGEPQRLRAGKLHRRNDKAEYRRAQHYAGRRARQRVLDCRRYIFEQKAYHSADKAAKCNACRRNKYISHIIPPIAVDAFYAALEKL